MKSQANKESNTPMVFKDIYIIQYVVAGPKQKADKKVSATLTTWIYNDCKAVFSGIGCFQSSFSLQVKDEMNHVGCSKYVWNIGYKNPVTWN